MTMPQFSAPDVAGPEIRVADSMTDDNAPSREDLLQRAAARGAARLTWESIVLAPTDPILGEKMLPRVAQRRARFRTFVKVALGACVAFCVVATGASAMSSGSPAQSVTATATALTKTAPATGIVPVEKLEVALRGKATSHALNSLARSTPAPKTFGAKRH
jgi:hypothetical protein